MSTERPFFPKILDLASGYSLRDLGRDLRAGLVVAAFAFPLCLAFGAATGLGPGAGLLTSIVAGFVAALFGGSRVQVTGPTAIFIVVAAGIVAVHGAAGLVIATLVAGLILVAFGALRLGPVLRFLPQPILVGFTAGIAVTLLVAQIRDLGGFPVPWLVLDLFGRLGILVTHLDSLNFWALGLGLATTVVVFVGDRWFPKISWSLVALVLGIAVMAVFDLPVPSLGEAFGRLSLAIRPLDFSGITYHSVVQLLPSAFTLAFLGAVESLLSASVADGLVHDRHRPNTELVGQGLANAASALVGGLPATGAAGRTNINVRWGARSPIAALVHSAVLLAVWAGLGFLAASVPLAVLAGIVTAVALGMVDFREFRLILKTTPADGIALVTTFLVTMAVDLAFAVISGLLVALLFFVRGMAQSSHTVELGAKGSGSLDRHLAADLPPGTHVLDLNGAFFFGAAGKFEEAIRPLFNRAQTILLRMDDVSLLDATGTRVLHRILTDARALRVRVVMCEVQPPVLKVMEQAELIQALGTSNLFASFEGALRDVRNRQPLVFATRGEEGCLDLV
jgi:SulP family sulfate permease